MIYYFIFSILGTIVATLLGALLSKISKNFNKEIEAFLQNFSVGAIIALLFIEIIPEGVESFKNQFENPLYGTLISLSLSLFIGLLFFVLHELLHKISHHHDHDEEDDEACEDHAHTTEIIKHSKTNLIGSLIFLGAISIHNIPEGLSLGTVFLNLNSNNIPVSGITFSIALLIHNLFIGYSMCSSFVSSGKSYRFSILMTLLSSVPAFLFSLLGYFINFNNNELFNAIIFSISSGSLLYVLFIELLPQIYYKHKSKYSFIYIILGILISIFVIMLG